MDLAKMISELQEERRRLDEAIEALERLSSASQSRRRGRAVRDTVELLDHLATSPDSQADAPPSRMKKSADRS